MREQKRIAKGQHFNALAHMLVKNAYEFLVPAHQYVDIKFNEKATMKGIKEENPYTLRLYNKVIEGKMEQKNTQEENRRK